MRAIIWAAVSTAPQAKKDSLAQQIKDGWAICEKFGWEVVETLQVKGHTRSYIFFQDAAEEILAYRRLRQLCENRAADVLVCRGRDRLGRTDALVAQVEALAKAAGIQIYSMTMPATIVEPGGATRIEAASMLLPLSEPRRRPNWWSFAAAISKV